MNHEQTASDMDRDEKSLLLYFESCAVDNRGRYQPEKMNDADVRNAIRWNNSGFVHSGRICHEDQGRTTAILWCRLSDDAHAVAAILRKARAVRGWDQRDYRTTAEKREEA